MQHPVLGTWPSWNISINYHESEPPRNMSWQPHGESNSGFIQARDHGRSQTAPAVVAYRGRLWCMWVDLDGNVWYTFTSDVDEGEFLPRTAFSTPGVPAMANLDGHLHAIILLHTGGIAHYLYDEDGDGQNSWICLGLLQVDGSGSPIHASHSMPCLVAFQEKLFLTFVNNGIPYYATWDPAPAQQSSHLCPTGTWSRPSKVDDNSQIFSDTPSLFTINGVLHLLCGTDSDTRRTLCFSYDIASSAWLRCTDITEGRAARGIGATSYGDISYLGFIESGSKYQTHSISIASFKGNAWESRETIAGQTAADPPRITILNGRIHCIFNDNTSTKDLRWYSRPILNYDLSSWMNSIPGDTLLSRITIPGTHDSCARSNIPYVRTQYLGIKQQLAFGIRYLDLRLRKHDDGELFLYHGGVPIGLSTRLSFKSVMDEVWTFLRGPGGLDEPTETVIVSIDNDDHSDEQKEVPEDFYKAVEYAISSTPPYPDGNPRWFVKPVTPRLDEVRGRAVLVRRYRGDPNLEPTARQGLDLSAWENDSPYFTIVTPNEECFHLQDKWHFTERISLKDLISAKSGFVQNMMMKAVTAPKASPPVLIETNLNSQTERQRIQSWSEFFGIKGKAKTTNNPTKKREIPVEDTDWYINFCSAVGDPRQHGEVAQAKAIAVGARSAWFGGTWTTGMNTITRGFIHEQQEELLQDEGGQYGTNKKYRLGVVNFDYPELPTDNDVVSKLIDINFLE